VNTFVWSFLGWRRFPRELGDYEIHHFFGFSLDDVIQLRRRFRRRARLGAGIQLGFVRMTGSTLDALDYIPREVMQHVAKQLDLGPPALATLRALYRRAPTLFAHQSWACEFAGLRWPQASDVERTLSQVICDSETTFERHRLERRAREVLFARGCLISGDREIAALVRDLVQFRACHGFRTSHIGSHIVDFCNVKGRVR
jgi:hypothetical protein